MDNTTRLIAHWAASLRFEDLPEEVVHAAQQRLVDALACAVASYGCEAAEIGLRLARGGLPERYPGRLLGSGLRSTAEAATFVNTALIRNLDFNDQYPGGHPSDALGALLALAETAGADGRRFLASMVVAYELFVRLNDATGLRNRGWDQGFVVGICTAAGVGNLLQVSPDVIAEAVAITAVASVPMRNTRAGKLSVWKGAATAFAARDAVFATLLAAEGVTGPDRPFEGHHGLWDLITGPFEVEPFPLTLSLVGRGKSEGKGHYRIPDVRLKYWPVEYGAQAAIWAALDLRSKSDWRELAEVDVGTDGFTLSEIGTGPEKWDPQNRETADHSLPYIFARTLVDGTITAASFAEAAYRDASLRPLMARIRVHKDEGVDAIYPETVAMRVAARSTTGAQHELEARNPLGHSRNPMQDADVNAKFLQSADPVLGEQRAHAALERWWRIDREPDLTEALDLLDLISIA